jgi:hypothetical protein
VTASRYTKSNESSKEEWGMRRIILAAVAAATLAAAAIALAGPGSGTTSVTGTFNATTVSKLQTSTCTGSDGTYQITDAHYSGTATSSDTHLKGPITIHARTVYNSTENLGTVRGELKIDPAGPGSISARLVAVDTNGALAGSVDGGAAGAGRLVGAFSGTFNPATGFSAASIGTGGNGALLINPMPCPKPHGPHSSTQHPSKPPHGPKK